MGARFIKAWLWKVFISTLVMCTVITTFLIMQTFDRKHTAFYRHLDKNSSVTKTSTESSKFVESQRKVLIRRYPYTRDAECKNFSLSIYEDETFNITGLISYPGSGNTWTRHLIQMASGVYTGSCYLDMDLISKGFLGESQPWDSGRTIVQKFHEKYNPIMNMTKAILIIREPFPAILSLANYLEAGHTGNAHSLPFHHKDWPKFILQSAYNWISLAKSWIESPVKLLVIHYERLRLKPEESIKLICEFLKHNCPFLNTDCFKKNIQGSFQRRKSFPLRTQLARYPDEIKNVVSRGVDHLNYLLKYNGYEPLPLNLYQYYSPLQPVF